MATWGQLSSELAQCEKDIHAIKHKSEATQREEAERYEQVAKKRQELIEAHNKNLRDAQEEHDNQMNNIMEKAKREIGVVNEAKARVEERARAATEKAEEADRRSQQLAKEILQVCALLDTTEANRERQHQEMRGAADRDVARVVEEARLVVHNAALYTSEVQEKVLAALGDMQSDSRESIASALPCSMERTKFWTMYESVMSRSDAGMTEEDYRHSTMEMVQAWYDEWAEAHSGLAPDKAALAPWPASDAEGQTLAPGDAGRERACTLARERALELKQLALEAPS